MKRGCTHFCHASFVIPFGDVYCLPQVITVEFLLVFIVLLFTLFDVCPLGFSTCVLHPRAPKRALKKRSADERSGGGSERTKTEIRLESRSRKEGSKGRSRENRKLKWRDGNLKEREVRRWEPGRHSCRGVSFI